MNRRDIIIGLVVLILIIGGVLWFRNRSSKKAMVPTTPTQEQIERSFNLTIPEDVDTAELRDVSGGTGSAVATRKFENGIFTHMILADLPDPALGTFYEGWLVMGKTGDSNFAFISTGTMRLAKGGYLLEFESMTDYSEYKGVVVTVEKTNDKAPETHLLEGSF